jgi:hypothetical protein
LLKQVLVSSDTLPACSVVMRRFGWPLLTITIAMSYCLIGAGAILDHHQEGREGDEGVGKDD